MTAAQLNIYDDFAEFIAGLSPEKVLAYHAPDKIQQRVEYLVSCKKEGLISPAESQELEKYFMFEHIVRLAKARALKLVAQSSAGNLSDKYAGKLSADVGEALQQHIAESRNEWERNI